MHAKTFLSIAAFIAAVAFGMAGTWIAPAGIIDSSMLYFIAQLLLYSATMVGFGTTIGKVVDILSQSHKSK